VANAAVKVRVAVSAKGFSFWWKLGPVLEKTLEVSADDVAGLEVKRFVRHESDTSRFDGATTVTYQLMLVTRAGRAIAIETFPLHTLADLRKAQVEQALAANAPKPKKSKKR
jgi:hypothetical protein